MEFFKNQRSIDFIGHATWAFAISLGLFLASATGLFWKGLHLGLDFRGGTQLTVASTQSIDLPHLRQTLHQLGHPHAQVQQQGGSRQAVIKLNAQHPMGVLKSALERAHLKVLRTTTVGPQMGRSLLEQGVLALVVSLLATMLYIALRFEWRFALSAALALLHDPILILGVFAWFGLEFDLITLAALLTILGYSLNDTIVVYDRVRENTRKLKKTPLLEILNRSINQTLSRTIMTSGLTLLVVCVLYALGGSTLQGFALALILGIIVGTYSSIYIASAVAHRLHQIR